MKKLLMATLTLLTSAVLLADTEATPRRRTGRRVGKPSGGIIEKTYRGKIFRVVSRQQILTGEELKKLTLDIRYDALLPIEVIEEAADAKAGAFELAEKLVAEPSVGAGAILVEDGKLPIFTLSPDRRWGILNVAPLKADNPAPELLIRRFTKVYWNIIARTLGAGTSSYPGCVLVPFTDLKELDAIRAVKPCPEPFNKMIDTGKIYGINTISIATYRTACQQGWAPPPKDEVQKKIWDETRELPANPLKIKK